MSYEKLRDLEKLLSNIYKKGLNLEQKKRIELYFEENYGKDSLAKPVRSQENQKEETIKRLKAYNVPDNLQSIIERALDRLGGVK
jgi:hypothetical protein